MREMSRLRASEGGGACDHLHAAEARQQSDDVAGHATGDVAEARIGAEVEEGQNEDQRRAGGGGGVGRRGRTRRVEPVPAAGHGAQDGPRIIPQGAADVADALHEAVVGDGGVAPDHLNQRILRDSAPGMPGQMLQNGEGLGAQGYLASRVVAQQAGLEIDGDVPDLHAGAEIRSSNALRISTKAPLCAKKRFNRASGAIFGKISALFQDFFRTGWQVCCSATCAATRGAVS